MGAVTTKAEQLRAGLVARRVGGYSELLRLAGERLSQKGGHFVRDDEGRYRVATAIKPISRQR